MVARKRKIITKGDVDLQIGGDIEVKNGGRCQWSFVAYKPEDIESRLSVWLRDWSLSRPMPKGCDEVAIKLEVEILAEDLDQLSTRRRGMTN